MERLQKVLAHAGVASRRKAEDFIAQGRVMVNGERAVLGMRVDAKKDSIVVDGRPLKEERRLYLLLYKPSGYLSTVTDPFKRPTIMDLLPPMEERVYPVGRLDKESRGLLLLTNDGLLTHRLIHPRYGVKKTYHVLLEGLFNEDPSLLVKGVPLEDGLAKAAQIAVLARDRETTLMKVILKEGKKRQIRRMFQYLECSILDLKRTAVAFLTLEGVKEGEHRSLTPQEIAHLYKLLSLDK